MAALTLRTHPEPGRFVAAFAGHDAKMADYLLAEVLARQPDDLVDFLLRTSIVDVVSGDLADAVTGRVDSEQVLARLEHDHALVTALGDDQRWRRYHPLLRELLVSELRYRHPEEFAPLHRRAAGWYADAGRPADALRHAAQAADWDMVAALAGEHWMPLMARGKLDALRSVLDALPRERVESDPELALALAAAVLELGDEPQAGALIERARARRDTVAAERRERFDLATATVGLVAARMRGDLAQAKEHARALADDDAARGDDLRSLELRSLSRLNLGIAELWTGASDDARRDLEAARRSASEGGCDWLLLLALAHLAAHAMLAGRLGRAGRLADETVALATERGWLRTWPVGLAEGVYSAVTLERNQLDDARHHFARCEELLAHPRDRPLRVAVRIQRARLQMAEGHSESALESLEAADDLVGDWPMARALRGLLSGSRTIVEAALGDGDGSGNGANATAEDGAAIARLRLRAGDADGAHAALAPWLHDAADAFGPTRVELWLLESLAADAGADIEAGAAALEHALDEAEPHGVRRPFTELGGDIATLLRRQLRRGTGHRSLVEELLRELDRPEAATRPRVLLLDPLSEREAAVLRFLPTMMSNGEIAAELFVSVNTVKTHLKSIYRKLDVPDRRGAVRRARELELLAP